MLSLPGQGRRLEVGCIPFEQLAESLQLLVGGGAEQHIDPDEVEKNTG